MIHTHVTCRDTEPESKTQGHSRPWLIPNPTHKPKESASTIARSTPSPSTPRDLGPGRHSSLPRPTPKSSEVASPASRSASSSRHQGDSSESRSRSFRSSPSPRPVPKSNEVVSPVSQSASSSHKLGQARFTYAVVYKMITLTDHMYGLMFTAFLELVWQ